MKFLVVLSCIWAAASAGHILSVVQPQHLPVIGPNGVPLEPAENVAARAAHAASHVEAQVRNGDVGVVAPITQYHSVATPLAYSSLAYAAPQHLPVIGPNGVPLEPAANVAARIEHANAHIEAKARNGDVDFVAPVVAPVAPVVSTYSAPVVSAYSTPVISAYSAPVVSAYSPVFAAPQHLPVIGANGVPLEPAENVAARASHAAAHIEAKVRNGDAAVVYSRKRRSVYAVPQHLPVIGPNGVPLEPAANVAARIEHANAHIEAKARNGDIAVAVASPLAYQTAAYAPAVAYTAAVHPAHTYPALAIDGQPLETPEVVAAKAAHFAAHIEARARNFDGTYYAAPYAAYTPVAYSAPVAHITHNGVPLDTPEVAAAKAAHFAAHAAARGF